MAVVRVGKRKWTDNSVKQDGRRQPHYNLTPVPPAATASLRATEQETRARIANTHRQFRLYILD